MSSELGLDPPVTARVETERDEEHDTRRVEQERDAGE